MSPLVGTELRVRDPDGEERGRGRVPRPVGDPRVLERPGRDGGRDRHADGWLATGDLGRLDEDGDLHLVDRKKDLIIRGGYNVYTVGALYAHPDVLEAAVIGVPDATLGEEVAALVVHPALHGMTVTAEARSLGEERVARYKVRAGSPSSMAPPKGRQGKILKRAIDPSTIL